MKFLGLLGSLIFVGLSVARPQVSPGDALATCPPLCQTEYDNCMKRLGYHPEAASICRHGACKVKQCIDHCGFCSSSIFNTVSKVETTRVTTPATLVKKEAATTSSAVKACGLQCQKLWKECLGEHEGQPSGWHMCEMKVCNGDRKECSDCSFCPAKISGSRMTTTIPKTKTTHVHETKTTHVSKTKTTHTIISSYTHAAAPRAEQNEQGFGECEPEGAQACKGVQLEWLAECKAKMWQGIQQCGSHKCHPGLVANTAYCE